MKFPSHNTSKKSLSRLKHSLYWIINKKEQEENENWNRLYRHWKHWSNY